MKRIENPHVAAAEGNRRQIKNIPEIIHRRRKTSVLPPAASAIKGITQSPACNYPSTEGLALIPPQNTALPRFFKTRQIPQYPSSSPLTAAAAGKRHHQELPHLAGRIRTKRKFPAIRIISFPVLRPFSGTCPQAGIRWPSKERKWRLRPAWPTENGPPTR